MSRDKYISKLTIRLYVIYKRAKKEQIPYSVYNSLWYLFLEETRRAKDFDLNG